MSVSDFISKLSQRQVNIIRSFLTPIEYLIILLDLIYPKNDKVIVIGSNTGEYASGSPKAMYQYINDNQEDYEVYYYLPFKEKMNLKERLMLMINFLPIFLASRVLISSHPTSDFFPFSWSRRKFLINVWHGVPIKSLFYADSCESENNLKKIAKLNNKTSFFTVSSKLESALIAECFLINPRKIQVTGHSRNDCLVSTEKKLKKLLGNISEETKIILYCPTYRRKSESKFFPFSDFDLNHLNAFLEKNNAIILIRGHVFNKLNESTEFFSERIIDFSFDFCNDVNSILNEVNIIITDYSSLYIDYLLLNRPCIFIPYDLEDYIKNRGLLIDDYDFWAPGEKVLTYSEFITSLNNIIKGNDLYEKRREEICNQFHYYKDGKSCERVFELIFNQDH